MLEVGSFRRPARRHARHRVDRDDHAGARQCATSGGKAPVVASLVCFWVALLVTSGARAQKARDGAQKARDGAQDCCANVVAHLQDFADRLERRTCATEKNVGQATKDFLNKLIANRKERTRPPGADKRTPNDYYVEADSCRDKAESVKALLDCDIYVYQSTHGNWCQAGPASLKIAGLSLAPENLGGCVFVRAIEKLKQLSLDELCPVNCPECNHEEVPRPCCRKPTVLQCPVPSSRGACCDEPDWDVIGSLYSSVVSLPPIDAGVMRLHRPHSYGAVLELPFVLSSGALAAGATIVPWRVYAGHANKSTGPTRESNIAGKPSRDVPLLWSAASKLPTFLKSMGLAVGGIQQFEDIDQRAFGVALTYDPLNLNDPTTSDDLARCVGRELDNGTPTSNVLANCARSDNHGSAVGRGWRLAIERPTPTSDYAVGSWSTWGTYDLSLCAYPYACAFSTYLEAGQERLAELPDEKLVLTSRAGVRGTLAQVAVGSISTEASVIARRPGDGHLVGVEGGALVSLDTGLFPVSLGARASCEWAYGLNLERPGCDRKALTVLTSIAWVDVATTPASYVSQLQEKLKQLKK